MTFVKMPLKKKLVGDALQTNQIDKKKGGRVKKPNKK